jgi:hypothetical protein
MELRSVVCSYEANGISILRGLLKSGGLLKRHEAPLLVDVIVRPKDIQDCPVSASLTDDDKAQLLKIKQDAEKEFPPPSESKKEK